MLVKVVIFVPPAGGAITKGLYTIRRAPRSSVGTDARCHEVHQDRKELTHPIPGYRLCDVGEGGDFCAPRRRCYHEGALHDSTSAAILCRHRCTLSRSPPRSQRINSSDP